jgi:hypothetical protein
MLIEETKKPLSMHPITLLVCFVCLIGLSVSATFLIVRAKYQSQSDNKNQEVQTIQKNNKALTDQNIELRNSLQKLEDEYSRLDAKLSKIEALNVDRQTLEQKYNGSKEMLAPYLILEPTLVGLGEAAKAFDGNLMIVLYEASDMDKCQQGSTAFTYLISGKDKTKLCLRTGKPESFKYRGEKYLFNLLESKKSKGESRYLISILKER